MGKPMAYTPEDRFEWDPAKADANRRKHGVSFEEARDLLAGPGPFREGHDEWHSEEEDRAWAVGPGRGHILKVVFTDADEGRIRILTARRATARERAVFRRWLRGKRL